MPELVKRYRIIGVGNLVLASDYDWDMKEARSVIAAILHADERGQGLPFQEAMDRAHAFLARTEE